MRRKDREINDEGEMCDILEKGTACHLSLIDGDEPYGISLNYGFERRGSAWIFYFHCAAAGRKLDIIKRNNRASVSVDVDHRLIPGTEACGWGMAYRSVIGSGRIDIVDGPAERQRGMDAIMRHYTGLPSFDYDEKIFKATLILKMSIDVLKGKKKE
jgi:nitroimidazol reductase NimA-like FMN-containing flavoprotein (pyridoxamine 5'-phosphate oxidase superfamily)